MKIRSIVSWLRSSAKMNGNQIITGLNESKPSLLTICKQVDADHYYIFVGLEGISASSEDIDTLIQKLREARGDFSGR